MNARVAKRLRKESQYYNVKIPEIVKGENLQVYPGIFVHYQSTKPKDPTKELIEAKQIYNELKKEYYNK